MYLIQDIVANHVGQFFEYNGTFNKENDSENFTIIKGNIPSLAPTQISQRNGILVIAPAKVLIFLMILDL